MADCEAGCVVDVVVVGLSTGAAAAVVSCLGASVGVVSRVARCVVDDAGAASAAEG